VFAPLGLKVAFGAGLLGLTGTAVALLALFTGRLERNRTNLTLVAILVFVGLTAALTAIGRSSFGLEQAASSRYATPSGVFWAAAVTLAVLWLTGRAGERTLPARVLVCGVTLVAVLAAARVQYEFRFQGRIRAADMARASDAILSGVLDESAWKVLFPDIALMKQRIPILQAHRLNIFSGPQPWPLGTAVPATRLTDAARCQGAVDVMEPVSGATHGYQLKGWAWDIGAQRPPERLVVLSEQQQAIGYGSSGWPRPDVTRAVAGISNFWTGWTAFAVAPRGRLGVYGVLGDGTLCPVGEKAVP
jgi:hypothetical protein